MQVLPLVKVKQGNSEQWVIPKGSEITETSELKDIFLNRAHKLKEF